MSGDRHLRVGTRGSSLALVQTEEVLHVLRTAAPDVEFEVVTITTRPDERREDPLASFDRGMFVKELELALLANEADLAVHSLKDLPTTTPPQLKVSAIGRRRDPRDALVSHTGLSLEALPPGSRVGTSSPRRVCQIRILRPDLEVVPLRGNVDTRLRKVEEGVCDAAVLAAAGLARLGLSEQVTQLFPAARLLPAPGQGALAVEARAGDAVAQELVGRLANPDTTAATTAERAFLLHLGGGCRVPIGAYAQVSGGRLTLTGMVSDEQGHEHYRLHLDGDQGDPEQLGFALAQRLMAMGARELVEAFRDD